MAEVRPLVPNPGKSNVLIHYPNLSERETPQPLLSIDHMSAQQWNWPCIKAQVNIRWVSRLKYCMSWPAS